MRYFPHQVFGGSNDGFGIPRENAGSKHLVGRPDVPRHVVSMVDLASTEVSELRGPRDLARPDHGFNFGLPTAKLVVLFLFLLH